MVLTEKGELYVAGDDSFGVLGLQGKPRAEPLFPVPIGELPPVKRVFAGFYYSLLVTDDAP